MICATNVDPDAAIKDGRLREDLYFRINTVTLRVPPLRERNEDLPLLCAHFLEKFNGRYQKNVKGISPAAYHLLIRFRWPGNVRELENAIERAVLVAKSTDVQPQDLPDSIRGGHGRDAFTGTAPHARGDRAHGGGADTAHELNKQEAAQIRTLPTDALQQDRSITSGSRPVRVAEAGPTCGVSGDTPRPARASA